MNRASVRIKNTRIKHLCIRGVWDFARLYGPEKFPGLSRNEPQAFDRVHYEKTRVYVLKVLAVSILTIACKGYKNSFVMKSGVCFNFRNFHLWPWVESSFVQKKIGESRSTDKPPTQTLFEREWTPMQCRYLYNSHPCNASPSNY